MLRQFAAGQSADEAAHSKEGLGFSNRFTRALF